MGSEFYKSLLFKIMSSLPNYYEDNYDTERFGMQNAPDSLVGKIYNSDFITKRFLNKSNQLSLFYTANNIMLDPLFGKLENLYLLLANQESKDLLVDVVAYRLLGHRKVKLPLSNPDYFNALSKCDELLEKKVDVGDAGKDNKTNVGFYNLSPIGYDLKMTFGRAGILTDFMLEQYHYKSKDKNITVNKGETVIECGGFWGDTSLYFATKVGANGKVFTFEFIPGNLKIMKTNLEQNPKYANNIQIVAHPVWEKSDLNVYYTDRGAASSVSMTDPGNGASVVKSKSIDTLVEEQQLEKVDFIKMDIEGAEPFALRGAENTLRKFKPTLAIAIYHSLSDFVGIPEYLDKLNLGYKFYLGHYTIHEEETILFATIH